jgi:hypothetical protein
MNQLVPITADRAPALVAAAGERAGSRLTIASQQKRMKHIGVIIVRMSQRLPWAALVGGAWMSAYAQFRF